MAAQSSHRSQQPRQLRGSERLQLPILPFAPGVLSRDVHKLIAFNWLGRCEPGSVLSGAESLAKIVAEPLSPEEFQGLASEDEDQACLSSFGPRKHGMAVGASPESLPVVQDLLTQRFDEDSNLASMLKKTRGIFLLEHSATTGKDCFWSDNCDGRGKNWMGALLMLKRAQLLRSDGHNDDAWAEWLRGQVQLETGKTTDQWQAVVQKARNAVIADQRASQAPSRTVPPDGHNSPKEGFVAQWFWGEALPGEFKGKESFRPYDAESSHKIERAFQKNKDEVFISIQTGGHHVDYRVDLLKKLQVNRRDSWKHARPIQRRELGVPRCLRVDCNRPSFDGREGEYCSRKCRDAVNLTRAENSKRPVRAAGSGVSAIPTPPFRTSRGGA